MHTGISPCPRHTFIKQRVILYNWAIKQRLQIFLDIRLSTFTIIFLSGKKMAGVWNKWKISWRTLIMLKAAGPINNEPLLLSSTSRKLEAATRAGLDLSLSRPGGFEYPNRAATAPVITRNRRKENPCGISLGTTWKPTKHIHLVSKCTIGIKCWDKWYKNTFNVKWNLDQKENIVWCYN